MYVASDCPHTLCSPHRLLDIQAATKLLGRACSELSHPKRLRDGSKAALAWSDVVSSGRCGERHQQGSCIASFSQLSYHSHRLSGRRLDQRAEPATGVPTSDAARGARHDQVEAQRRLASIRLCWSHIDGKQVHVVLVMWCTNISASRSYSFRVPKYVF